MDNSQYLASVENLLDPAANVLLNMDYAAAEAKIASGDPSQIHDIHGQFAIATQVGRSVYMARSIGCPMRYFLAKQTAGPCLIIAARIETIRQMLEQMGALDQFHPSYTRMVPAHYLTKIELVGCPDPNPQYERFFTPSRERLPADIDVIGRAYIGALMASCNAYLDRVDSKEPIGVLFSGGIDSGAVLLTMYHVLLRRGESPSRLKAFTLRVDRQAADADQAADFVRHCGIELLLEIIDVSAEQVDWQAAIEVMEDYKPLDVQSGAMALALCRGIRAAYPDWRCLVDGDGGDENLKDYPIEENPELTIRSVLNNLMLYQEGWGVHSIKHSLTFSGGQSRGHIRTSAPAASLGFEGFSPFALPAVIDVAEGIPFIELTQWDHQRLYDLKGQIVSAGIRQWFNIDMPTFAKRRFQHGGVDLDRQPNLFPTDEAAYRQHFASLWL